MILKVTVVKKEFRFKMDQTFPVWFAIDKRYKRSVISMISVLFNNKACYPIQENNN